MKLGGLPRPPEYSAVILSMMIDAIWIIVF
jgi:hypothetical protein